MTIKRVLETAKNFIAAKIDPLLDPQKNHWIFVVLILMVASFWISSSSQSKTESAPSSEQDIQNQSIDTFVPQGYVLVSLQLTNADSIGSMMGNYSLIDLYSVRDPNDISRKEKNLPVASHLRLIRSPNNPNLFGVLVPETAREVIRSLAFPVFGVIKNPNATKEESKPKPSQKWKGRTIRIGDFL